MADSHMTGEILFQVVSLTTQGPITDTQVTRFTHLAMIDMH